MPRYDGGALANAKPKSLLRLLRGTAAEEAVPLLLAARDAYLAAAEGQSPPHEFVCAISQQLMVDPVTTGAGQTYEREAIATWLRTKQTDPLTGARLPSKKLIENVVARQAIARWREEHPGYTEF